MWGGIFEILGGISGWNFGGFKQGIWGMKNHSNCDQNLKHKAKKKHVILLWDLIVRLRSVEANRQGTVSGAHKSEAATPQ